MFKRLPNVFSIVAGAPFLNILAQKILDGFPISDTSHPLSDWTVLLPTKRAASAFTKALLDMSKQSALVLPRIRTLGELDEQSLQDDVPIGDLPPSMSSLAVLFELTNLVNRWAAENSGIDLARELLASPSQVMNLVNSLVDIIVTMETYNLSKDDLAQIYDLDIAEHRQTITSLLELVLRDLPNLQREQAVMGATARRHAMIRAEAQRISSNHKGPIIAAGSTGSTPATRELLLTIACHPQGAVILPGLDHVCDDQSWSVLKPEHPQFALKTLLLEFGIKRQQVKLIGPSVGARNLLSSEIFRPTETTPHWHSKLPSLKEDLAKAVEEITEIVAPDRHLEARTIACILRDVLNTPGKTAALVTPDRDLAQRVVAEMERWNTTLSDSAGEALSRHGLGAALDLLLQAVSDGFSLATTMAFLRHPLVSFDYNAQEFANLVHHFELAVLRGPVIKGVALDELLQHAREKASDEHHLHPTIKAMNIDDWDALAQFVTVIKNLQSHFVAESSLTAHLQAINNALRFAITKESWTEASSGVIDLLQTIQNEAHRLPLATVQETSLFIRQLLRSEKQPPSQTAHKRLAILGTLEARLLPFDVIVLGGLNETVWPATADPGPWLNRPMREKLKLPLPERDIGMAAHDFEQAFCCPKVYLTWSKRLNLAPQSPSRWLLRMKAVLEAAGVAPPNTGPWLSYAKGLQIGDVAEPLSKPNFSPPIAARPTKFSVTEVERLIRNPYAVYAKRILKLEPLPKFSEQADARLRGSLFHDAIGNWNKEQATSIEHLLEEGDKALARLGESAEERHFWAPHFTRLAKFLWDEQEGLRDGLLKIHAELNGKIKFDVASVEHNLTARADRIDIMQNGIARIIDYKTGEIPTTDQVKAEFSPQLTLEAAILLDGGFEPKPKAVAELLYFRIAGGAKGLQKKLAVDGGSEEIYILARKHLASFVELLLGYQNPKQPYLPRVRIEKEDEPQDYDHLSRYLEWQLAGQET